MTWSVLPRFDPHPNDPAYWGVPKRYASRLQALRGAQALRKRFPFYETRTRYSGFRWYYVEYRMGESA